MELDVAVVLAAREGEVSRAGARPREHEARHARKTRGLVLGAAPAGRLEPLVRDRERPEASFFGVRRDLVEARELRLGLFLCDESVRRRGVRRDGRDLSTPPGTMSSINTSVGRRKRPVTTLLAMMRRVGYSAGQVLTVQLNLACAYQFLGRREQAIRMQREVYAGRLRLSGEEAFPTLLAANNLASSLARYRDSYGEAKTLWRTLIPIARRSLGEGNDLTLTLEINYARTLYEDTGATLDDIREAVTRLEDAERIARRILGGSHPLVVRFEDQLHDARAELRVRETPPGTR